MNIVLIGYRCSGKTSVGRLLAEALHLSFLDTDCLIEETTGMPIFLYVSRRGWTDFRDREKEVVREAAREANRVIATGGGVVMDPENLDRLKENGWIVWLAADASVIRERMALALGRGALRPSLSGTDPLEEIESLLAERNPQYEKACDLRIGTDRLTPEAIARHIMEAMPRGFGTRKGRIS